MVCHGPPQQELLQTKQQGEHGMSSCGLNNMAYTNFHNKSPVSLWSVESCDWMDRAQTLWKTRLFRYIEMFLACGAWRGVPQQVWQSKHKKFLGGGGGGSVTHFSEN